LVAESFNPRAECRKDRLGCGEDHVITGESVLFEKEEEVFHATDVIGTEAGVVITENEEKDLFDFRVRESEFKHSIYEDEDVSEGVEVLCVIETGRYTSVKAAVGVAIDREEGHVVIP
jgi:hypothetical protein